MILEGWKKLLPAKNDEQVEIIEESDLFGFKSGIARPRKGLILYRKLTTGIDKLVEDGALFVALGATMGSVIAGQNEDGTQDWSASFVWNLVAVFAELVASSWENVVAPLRETNSQKTTLSQDQDSLERLAINEKLGRVNYILERGYFVDDSTKNLLIGSMQALFKYKKKFENDSRWLNYIRRAAYSSGILEVSAMVTMFFSGAGPVISGACGMSAILACITTVWNANPEESARARRAELAEAAGHVKNIMAIVDRVYPVMKEIDNLRQNITNIHAAYQTAKTAYDDRRSKIISSLNYHVETVVPEDIEQGVQIPEQEKQEHADATIVKTRLVAMGIKKARAITTQIPQAIFKPMQILLEAFDDNEQSLSRAITQANTQIAEIGKSMGVNMLSPKLYLARCASQMSGQRVMEVKSAALSGKTK